MTYVCLLDIFKSFFIFGFLELKLSFISLTIFNLMLSLFCISMFQRNLPKKIVALDTLVWIYVSVRILWVVVKPVKTENVTNVSPELCMHLRLSSLLQCVDADTAIIRGIYR